MTDNLDILLKYMNERECEDTARMYNRISNMFYQQFKIANSGMSLLCFYIVNEYINNYLKEGLKDAEKEHCSKK